MTIAGWLPTNLGRSPFGAKVQQRCRRMLWRSSHPLPLARLKPNCIVKRSRKQWYSGQNCVAAILSSAKAIDADPVPRKVQVTGHVRTIRNQKRISFAAIGDGSTTAELQTIMNPVQAKGYRNFPRPEAA